MPSPVASILGWILFGLCFGMSALAETDPEFSQCSQSFYKQRPPTGFTGGQLLQFCHSLGGGQSFATLYNSSCDITVFSAFCLNKGWGDSGTVGESQEGGGPKEDRLEADTESVQTETKEEESQNEGPQDTPVKPPALLWRDRGDSSSYSATPASTWDAVISNLVQNNVLPQCQSVGGDLYVLTGTGSVDELAKGCEVGLFWSAVCCDVPNEDTGFSLGAVKEGDEVLRVLSVKALEEVVGVGDVFAGGCGKADGGGEGESDPLAVFQAAVQQIVEKHITDAQPHSDELLHSSISEDASAQSTDAQGTETETEGETIDAEPRRAVSLNTDAESSDFASQDIEQVRDTEQTEPEGNSTVLYLLSSSLYLLSVPFRPLVSTLAEIPGQVSHVIQEDLTVLSSLPCDTFSLFQNLVSDAAWGVTSVGGLLGKAGALCACQLYSCTSPLVGTLIDSCKEGIAGAGTLTWDGVGVFGGIVDGAWSVSRFIGGKAWEQSEGYLCGVLSELGSQVQGVGGGLGKLVMKGGKGVGNVVKTAGWVIKGVGDMAVNMVKGAFGSE
ncbi:endonuclease domain-containing 1 protein [Megalops cyprinoides]|uniref:endonuclease domain-containing 1 protein n=1 Tax=Megalops cyprinoides TaxID=118141 RepID=UPI001863D121|nr:endonuclease domain-containing 1 protein [Megalops cyprinoides]